MAQTHVEIETKYELPEDTDVPALDSLPHVASVAEPVAHELEATYFDTRELDLAAAGVTVRRRTGGDDAGWHVKLPVADGRYEVHEPLGRSTKTVPKPIREIVQTITRDAALQPVVTVRTHRTVHRLLDAGDDVLAEVSDDRVTSQGPGETVPRAWRELEIELVGADSSLLDGADRVLKDHGLEPSSSQSKLRRALGDRAPQPHERTDAPRHDRSAALVQARLGVLVDEVRQFDPLVRADAPDSVHRMRVATRRLRSVLATFRPLFDREVTEPLRDDLKWFAGVLGDARDAEVLRKRLLAQLDKESPEMVRGNARSYVDKVFASRYRDAHRFCMQNMQSSRYLELVDRLEQLASAPPWADGAQRRGPGVLRKRVRHDYKRLDRRVRNVRRARDKDERAERFHEVRKAAKRVRYATEPLEPVYGKKAKRLEKAMKQVQSVLGDHQDTAVTRRELHQLSDRAATERVNAYSMGVLDIRQEQRAAKKRAQFASTWGKASSKRLRGWLS
jgi:CHAD domain-containing protein